MLKNTPKRGLKSLITDGTWEPPLEKKAICSLRSAMKDCHLLGIATKPLSCSTSSQHSPPPPPTTPILRPLSCTKRCNTFLFTLPCTPLFCLPLYWLKGIWILPFDSLAESAFHLTAVHHEVRQEQTEILCEESSLSCPSQCERH